MRLLFTSGTARGGTNLRTFMLDQHPEISMAIDPFIPLFRHYRDCLVRGSGRADLLAGIRGGVLDDYYFSDAKIELMRAIQSADSNPPFDMTAWPRVRASLISRLTLTSANLLPHVDEIPAATFKEAFQNLQQIVSNRKPGPLKWVGFNDNWAAEFIPHLSRLFPDARFMLHLRDPRAVISSSEFAEPDLRKRPTVLSFGRHIRKYIALWCAFESDPGLRERVLTTQYEPFLTDPEGQVRRMTNFLELEFNQDMVDVSRFRRVDGSPWDTGWDVYRSSGDIWRSQMPSAMAEVVEFVCSPDMRLLGYEPTYYADRAALSAEAFDYVLQNTHACAGWSTDFAEVEHTLGCEMVRQRMLSSGAPLDESEIARCYLFPHVYEALCDRFGGGRTEYRIAS